LVCYVEALARCPRQVMWYISQLTEGRVDGHLMDLPVVPSLHLMLDHFVDHVDVPLVQILEVSFDRGRHHFEMFLLVAWNMFRVQVMP